MKGGDFVKSFTAKNPKQLNLCLRLMHAEKVSFVVKVRETERKKIYFEVTVEASRERLIDLEEKYRILIS